MITYDLPHTLTVGGKQRAIRYDYRAALDIIIGLTDPDLAPHDKAELVLGIMYVDPVPRALQAEALKQAYWFLDGGQTHKQDGKKSPRLVDWEHDFPLIVAPVNRVLGTDIRGADTIHWWTFLSAYMEIGGDCVFSQVVNIRNKRARGEKMEKYELKWAKRNADIVDMPQKYSERDNDTLARFGIKAK